MRKLMPLGLSQQMLFEGQFNNMKGGVLLTMIKQRDRQIFSPEAQD